jgi:pimeloyl-ACP methyl ester carboxylesterase
VDTPLSIAKQGSFFVGGRDVKSDALSLQPAVAASGTVTVDQMYVRYQVPVRAQHDPIVLIHGCCLTGKTWETTPDGRTGWDEYFLRMGHAVYVIDQTWRGRSAGDISAINTVKSGRAPTDKLPTVFAPSRETAWTALRFGPEYPKSYEGQRYPLAGIDEFWKQMVPDWSGSQPKPSPTVQALSSLGKQLKRAVLMSHSQSGNFPFQVVQIDTAGISAIVSIEPVACPDATADIMPFTKIPILVLFGDYVELSTRWAPRLKGCREYVTAVKAAGGTADLIVLPEIGIKGNTHMLMQDSNSLEIADLLSAWIVKVTEK